MYSSFKGPIGLSGKPVRAADPVPGVRHRGCRRPARQAHGLGFRVYRVYRVYRVSRVSRVYRAYRVYRV